jgi:acetyl esterase/lipase
MRRVIFTAFALLVLASGSVLTDRSASARPGEIIRITPLSGGGPGDANAFRILYRSTSPGGAPIEVSGAIWFPEGDAPEGGRPVVAWAHPTTGVVEKCAPSLHPGSYVWTWGLSEMLEKGYVVVATDYPGLGTPGVHPYLVGESEARAVIDSVRAARAIPETGAQDRFAVWGHSQGGHAALFTGQIAKAYAPELRLVGVAAAAPATELAALFEADLDTETGNTLSAMALWSWSKYFNHPIGDLVAPADMGAFEQVAHDCLETGAQALALEEAAAPLGENGFLKADPTKIEPWRGIMQRNTPGAAPPGAPVYIAQGSADTTVHPDITKRFAEGLCRHGHPVSMAWFAGVTHTYIARDAAPDAVRWIADRFAGEAPPSDC